MHQLLPWNGFAARWHHRRRMRRSDRPRNRHSNWSGLLWRSWLLILCCSAPPAVAAERVIFAYGVFEQSISLKALEVYAREGKLTGSLAAYAPYIQPQQGVQLRQILNQTLPVQPITVSHFLYTPQGESTFEILGQVVQTEAGQSGFSSLRAAFIQAAADPQGLTLINTMRHFPGSAIRVDLHRAFQIRREIQKLIEQTTRAIDAVEGQAALAVTQQTATCPLAIAQGMGHLNHQLQTLALRDTQRNRSLLVDFYVPQAATALGPELPASPTPVVVLTHGLNSNRTTFKYLAEHLVSHGFAVVVPEHPDINTQQLQALVQGRTMTLLSNGAVIQPAIDIQLILDHLSRDPSFASAFNWEQVGVIGQSLGGFTALVLAGAPISEAQVRQNCNATSPLQNVLNISRLLQCHTQDVMPPYPLRDRRVVAAIALNPTGSSILGPASLSQIQIPVMLMAGSADVVAPALPEQIQPFEWLTTPDKYLLLIRGGTHFSGLDPSAQERTLLGSLGDLGEHPSMRQTLAQLSGPHPDIVRNYITAFSVAFFQAYVSQQSQYLPCLNSLQAKAMSQKPLDLNLLQSRHQVQVE